jgi:hypothetical protein
VDASQIIERKQDEQTTFLQNEMWPECFYDLKVFNTVSLSRHTATIPTAPPRMSIHGLDQSADDLAFRNQDYPT